MSLAADLKAINCTECGAGLDVLGGGRVSVHICPYCGSELDAQDNYKVLRKFADLERPASPLSLGMSGTIDGAEYTVIGRLGLEERWAGRVWRWVDHQLYSPTHGYAWISTEDGHYTFTRRYRKSGWINLKTVENSEKPPHAYSDGATYRYYDTVTSTITYAEGEFTWAPRIGERSTSVNAMSDDAMLSFQQSSKERETYRTTYLAHDEVAQSFGFEPRPAPDSVHALQPYREKPNEGFLSKSSAVLALLAMLLAFVAGFSSGGDVLSRSGLDLRQGAVTLPLPLSGRSGLVEVTLAGNTSNSWAVIAMALIDEEGEDVLEAEGLVEYYFGRSSDGSWTEGNNRDRVRFRSPREAGTYQLVLSLGETGHYPGAGVIAAGQPTNAISTLAVRVSEGHSATRWLWWPCLGFALAAVFFASGRFRHSRRRWAGSDWTDEED